MARKTFLKKITLFFEELNAKERKFEYVWLSPVDDLTSRERYKICARLLVYSEFDSAEATLLHNLIWDAFPNEAVSVISYVDVFNPNSYGGRIHRDDIILLEPEEEEATA